MEKCVTVRRNKKRKCIRISNSVNGKHEHENVRIYSNWNESREKEKISWTNLLKDKKKLTILWQLSVCEWGCILFVTVVTSIENWMKTKPKAKRIKKNTNSDTHYTLYTYIAIEKKSSNKKLYQERIEDNIFPI